MSELSGIVGVFKESGFWIIREWYESLKRDNKTRLYKIDYFYFRVSHYYWSQCFFPAAEVLVSMGLDRNCGIGAAGQLA